MVPPPRDPEDETLDEAITEWADPLVSLAQEPEQICAADLVTIDLDEIMLLREEIDRLKHAVRRLLAARTTASVLAASAELARLVG